jgi:hypothetical protein
MGPLLVWLCACAPEDADAPGRFRWRITLGDASDSCAPDAPVDHVEAIEYAVTFHRSAAVLLLDGERFATGEIIGCGLVYTTEVDATELPFTTMGTGAWDLDGAAEVETDGDACVDGDSEWSGTETWTHRAEDECAVTYATTGEFLGEE